MARTRVTNWSASPVTIPGYGLYLPPGSAVVLDGDVATVRSAMGGGTLAGLRVESSYSSDAPTPFLAPQDSSPAAKTTGALRIIFVNPSSGSDSSDGSENFPLLRLSEALRRIPSNVGLDRYVVCVIGAFTPSAGVGLVPPIVTLPAALPEFSGAQESTPKWSDVAAALGVPMYSDDVLGPLPPVVIAARPRVIASVNSALGAWAAGTVKFHAAYSNDVAELAPDQWRQMGVCKLQTFTASVAAVAAPLYPILNDRPELIDTAVMIAGRTTPNAIGAVFGAHKTDAGATWKLHACVASAVTMLGDVSGGEVLQAPVGAAEIFDVLEPGAVLTSAASASIPSGYGFYGIYFTPDTIPPTQRGNGDFVLCYVNRMDVRDGGIARFFGSVVGSLFASKGTLWCVSSWVHDISGDSGGNFRFKVAEGSSVNMTTCFVDFDFYTSNEESSSSPIDAKQCSLGTAWLVGIATPGRITLNRCDVNDVWSFTPGSVISLLGCGTHSFVAIRNGVSVHILHDPVIGELPSEVRINGTYALGAADAVKVFTRAQLITALGLGASANYANDNGVVVSVYEVGNESTLATVGERTNIV